MKKLFIISLLFLLSITSYATTYYVNSNAGNDGSAGTATGAAWLTLTNVNNPAMIADGDIISIAANSVLYGSLTIHRNHLTFLKYNSGADPIITGFTTVSSWTNLGGNIFESSSAISTLNDCNMVVINGVNTAMGRTPNTGWYNIDSHSGNTSITSSSLTGTPNWGGGDVVMKIFNFSIQRNVITSQSGSSLSYTSGTGDNANNNYGFFIENDSLTLDQQNEWWYSPSRKKLRIYSTSTPINVQASTLDTLVYISGQSDITFDGIDFTGSNRRAFFICSSSNITIQNCNFNYHGLYAIWGGNNCGTASANFNFNHNTVNHVNSKAVQLASEFANPYFGYNIFKNCGVLQGMFKPARNDGTWDGAYGAIFTNNVNNVTIEHNLIDSTGYNGIHLANPDNAKIDSNEVSHHCLLLMDGGGIYMYSGSAQTNGSKIYSNIVHDGYGDNSGTNDPTEHLAHGIYLDRGFGGVSGFTNHVQVYNNTCFNNNQAGIFSNSNNHCNFHHNTCFNNAIQFLAAYSGYTSNNDTLISNKFIAKDSSQYCLEINSDTTTIGSFSKADSNYYAKPVIDNSGYPYEKFSLSFNSYSAFSHYTLSQWQVFSGLDIHSYNSPITASSTSGVILETNTTGATQTYALPYNYMAVNATTYNGTITLAPYTSAALIYNGPITGNINPNILISPHSQKVYIQ